MKTFNIIRLFVVVVLGMSMSAFAARNCNTCPTKSCPVKKACAPCAPCAGQVCRLKPDLIEVTKTCDKPGYYKQISRLEYIPCQGETVSYKACPQFLGCFDENGNRLDGNGSVVESADNSGVAYTQTAQVETKRFHRNGRNVRTAPMAAAIVQ